MVRIRCLFVAIIVSSTLYAEIISSSRASRKNGMRSFLFFKVKNLCVHVIRTLKNHDYGLLNVENNVYCQMGICGKILIIAEKSRIGREI